MTLFTVVTCHFGSDFWIKQLVSSLEPNELISKVYVGHHFQPSDTELNISDRITFNGKKINVIEKISDEKPPHPSDAHAEMLLYILKNCEFTTPYILILDSDIVILKETWAHYLESKLQGYDAMLAISNLERSRTHPCFMAFRKELLSVIDIKPFHTLIQYDRKLKEYREDTGSNTGSVLLKLKYRVRFTEPKSLFQGRFFHKYLQGEIAHVGSQSLRTIFGKKSEKLGKFTTQLHYELPKFFIYKTRKKPKWLESPPPYLYLVLLYIFSSNSFRVMTNLFVYITRRASRRMMKSSIFKRYH